SPQSVSGSGVVNDFDVGCRGSGSAVGCGRHAGEREREARALADRALDADAAAVRLDDALDEEQAETRATVVARQRVLDLEELLEDPAVVAPLDADAVVGDG